MNDQDIEIELCRADFYYMFAKALDECGGCSDSRTIERYQDLRLAECVDILAQNGLRITYDPKWHMENLKT